MIIDVHTHVVPEHFPPVAGRASGARWPIVEHTESGTANVIYEGKNFRTILDRCWRSARRVEELESMGVDRQVLSPMPRLLNYDLPADDAVDLAHHINKFIVGMVEEEPERFYGLGAVPLQHVDRATKELTRIKDMGLLGVEVQTNIAGKNLGDPEFRPFLREAERLGLSVFSHAQNPTFMDRIVGSEGANSVGFPIENAFAVAGVITGRVLEECPGLRICFSHGGGTAMQFLPRMQNQWSNGGALKNLLPKSPMEYARQAYYDDVIFDSTTLRYLIDMVGSSQIVVGSDYPFGGDFRFALKPEAEFDELGLTEDEREAIGSRNALRFLGLES